MDLYKLLLILLVLTIFANGMPLNAQGTAGVQLKSYYQEVKSDLRLPEKASSNVIKLIKGSDHLVVITSNGVFRYNNGTWWGEPFGADWKSAATDIKGVIWLASAQKIQREGEVTNIELPDFAQKDTILSLFWEDGETLQVGTNNGLLTYNGGWNSVPITMGKRINSIVKDHLGDLWLATNDGLIRRIGQKWFNMDDHLMAKGLKRHYCSLESNAAKKEVRFGGLFAVGCISEAGDNWLLRGADGLPYGPITTIHSNEKTLWLGTDRGAIKKETKWHYYNGKRWLPSNKVNDILTVNAHETWIATNKGVSIITESSMTLDQKAKIFEERIKLRHDRYGIISRSQLTTPGDLSSSKTLTNDNDGLWSSIYLAAESFRFAVTKDPQAKSSATRTYEALERLETVTGIPGLPARSFAAAGDTVIQSRSPHPKKWHLSNDGKWQWLDDASSDELAGHMFAFALYYDLVADGKTKQRIRGLVDRIMTHIITNNFQLIDFDGEPTKWAIWNPDSLNNIPGRWYERGTNSLQILSFLKTAVHITHDQKFENAYQFLIKKHHYAQNTLEAKRDYPFENSHSDDILTYLPYYNLLKYSAEPELRKIYLQSLERAWNIARPEKTPLWNIIATVSLRKECDLKLAMEELELIPMDMITWTMENSHRWDLPSDQLLDRSHKTQSTRIIPTPEAAIIKANSNPREYDSGSDGAFEDDGAYFLLPYWMGRYHKLLRVK